MSLPSFASTLSFPVARTTKALLVCDVDGQYRVANADEFLTQALKTALQLVDVRVLYHVY